MRAKKNKGDKNNNARDSQEEGKEKKAKACDSDVSPIEANYTPWVIVLTQAFYFLVFHNLANLPMGDKLLFGVHQRFWMQPNVVTFALCGVGFGHGVLGVRIRRWPVMIYIVRRLALVYKSSIISSRVKRF